MNDNETIQQLKREGDDKFKAKDWKGCCDAYDMYYSQKYPNEEEMSHQDSILLVKYAEALINFYSFKLSNEGKDDVEDLQTAGTYLLTARAAMDLMDPSEYPAYSLLDTYALLANIGLMTQNFEKAAQENLDGYERAITMQNCSWRDKLSLLFSASVANEYAEQKDKAIDILNQCIQLVNEEKSKEQSHDVIELLDSFMQEFEEKLTKLRQNN